MRRLHIVSIGCLTLLLISAGRWSDLQAQQFPSVRFTVTTSQAELALSRTTLPDQNQVTRVRLLGADLIERPGFPRLPFFTRVVAIPGGAKVEQVAVTLDQETSVGDVKIVEWGQLPRPNRDPLFHQDAPDAYLDPPGIPPDPGIGQYPVWPETSAELVQSIDAAGYKILTFDVYPVRWYIQEGRLGLHTSVGVEVSYSGGALPQVTGDYAQAMEIGDLSSSFAIFRRRFSEGATLGSGIFAGPSGEAGCAKNPWIEPPCECRAKRSRFPKSAKLELRGLVDNPEIILQAEAPSFPEELDAWYLIVTDNSGWRYDLTRGPAVPGDMVAEFRRLAEWKTQKGIQAQVVTISDAINILGFLFLGYSLPPGTTPGKPQEDLTPDGLDC